MHVWDLRDEGVDPVLGWAADAGLNQVHIAGSYHGGWFVQFMWSDYAAPTASPGPLKIDIHAYLQVNMADLAHVDSMDRIFRETFPESPPARSTIQVMPGGGERVQASLVGGR